MDNGINAEDRRNPGNVTIILDDPMEVEENEDINLQQIGNLRGRCCRCFSYEECRGLLYFTSIAFFCYGIFSTYLISTTEKPVEPFNLVTTKIVGGVTMMMIMTIASSVTYRAARDMAPAANPRRVAINLNRLNHREIISLLSVG
jgi:hypothetical protein